MSPTSCLCSTPHRNVVESSIQWRRVGSNHRPIDYEPIALTTELRRQMLSKIDSGEPYALGPQRANSPENLGLLQYPRQDSNLRHRLRRPVLYPLSYGGLHATNDAVGFIPPILSSPSSVSSHRLPQGRPPTWPELPVARATSAPAATGPNRSSCPNLLGPPALLPWLPHLRAAVTGRHPRLSGELSPLPAERDRGPAPNDRSALCCGCCHRFSQSGAPACCFAGPTCMWQSGSSSGPDADRSRPGPATDPPTASLVMCSCDRR